MEQIVKDFLDYVSYDTQSQDESDEFPSTAKQKVLAEHLAEQLRGMGLNGRMDDYGYVYANIPANCEGAPAVGFIAHMDTATDAFRRERQAPHRRIMRAGTSCLNEEKNIVMRAAEFESLAQQVGKDLIVTDGTTLLGADDKAGVAEIMAMARCFVEDPDVPHGKICISFTPDEEIGRRRRRTSTCPASARTLPIPSTAARSASYNYENFNACAAKVAVRGVSIHPGSAKHKMKNAARIAMQFASLLPAGEVPELTEGYEGFSHLTNMSGDCENAVLHYIIRDHDREKFEQKKQRFERVAAFLNAEYGEGTVTLSLRDTYYNMKEVILPDQKRVLDLAVNAMKGMGIAPVAEAIRGGTDGCRLSFMGLPCPNLCTGGYNCHGRYEYISVQSLKTCAEILIRIAKDAAK